MKEHLTEETKKKISINNARYWLGKKRPSMSEETRRKISVATLGRKKSKEAIKNMSKARTLVWDKKGRKTENRDKHVGTDYTTWRTAIFTRDNWTCQTCQRRGFQLEAHHIKSWAKYPMSRFEITNGVTLCKKPCHVLANKEQRKNEKTDCQTK